MIQQQKEHDKAISNYQIFCLALLALIMLSTKYSVNKNTKHFDKFLLAALAIVLKKSKIITYFFKFLARSARTNDFKTKRQTKSYCPTFLARYRLALI